MAWNTVSTVISFIMLDGARNSSAFFSNNTLPLVGLDQDRGRRIAGKAALFLLRALHALVGGERPRRRRRAIDAQRSAIRRRQEGAPDLPENDVAAAMGGALKSGVLTVGSNANNTAAIAS